jgi:arylsulfatase A-like enzyme
MPAPRVILVIFDGLRPDMVVPELAPNLTRFADRGSRFPLSRAVFPTETRVNVAALVTGCKPARHGIVANQFYAPEAIADRSLNTGHAADLAVLDTVSGGQLLGAPSLGERLARAGKSLAVVSTGSTGSGLLLHHRAESLNQFRWSSHGLAYSSPAAAEVDRRFGEAPKRATPNTACIDHAMTVFLDHVLTGIGPDVAVFWSSDPDSTYHHHGIGSGEAKASIRGADAAFGRLVDRWEREGFESGTQIICLSDHGHITGRAKLDMPALFRAAGFRVGTGLDADTDIALAPGAPAGLSVRDAAIRDRAARWLAEQPWCGLLFSNGRNEVEGEVPGSFSFALAGTGHARRPDLFFTLADDDENDANGIAGTGYFDAQLPLFAGVHGGLHPRELNNVLIAGGDAFRQGYASPFASGIVDVLPTVLHLLDLPAYDVDGRVLIEAMGRGETPGAVRKLDHTVEAPGFARRLDRQVTGPVTYLDGGYAV